MVVILVALVIILTRDAMPAINKFGFHLLPIHVNPVTDVFGALPAIYGTLITSLIGLLIAVTHQFRRCDIPGGTGAKLVESPASLSLKCWRRSPVSLSVYGDFMYGTGGETPD